MKVSRRETVEKILSQEIFILYNDNGDSRDVIIDWLPGEWKDKQCEIPSKGVGVVFNNTHREKILHLPEGIAVSSRTKKLPATPMAIPHLTTVCENHEEERNEKSYAKAQ